jgi:uncharacterized protein DUF6262
MSQEQAKTQDWSRSGPEQGEIYAAMFQTYLDNLKLADQSLPADAKGKPNITTLSKDSGVPRASFYTNKTIKRMLCQMMGASEGGSDDSGKDAYYQDQIETLKRRNQYLEQRLAVAEAENESLRQSQSRYKVIEDSVIKAGRGILL